jgi:single-strand DNA-binding protein
MNSEVQVTVTGNVTQDVRHVRTEQGVPITTFRLASTRRQFDRSAGRWVDGETTFVNVTCWRALAEHVRASVSKGDPVVVIGRLRIRSWEREGYKGNAVEIDAYTVGHDLVRGTSAFRRTQARAATAPPEREVADDLLVSMEAGALQDQQADGAGARPPGWKAGDHAGDQPGSRSRDRAGGWAGSEPGGEPGGPPGDIAGDNAGDKAGDNAGAQSGDKSGVPAGDRVAGPAGGPGSVGRAGRRVGGPGDEERMEQGDVRSRRQPEPAGGRSDTSPQTHAAPSTEPTDPRRTAAA